MALQQLHDGNAEGVVIGAAATDIVGFHGAYADQAAVISLTTGATVATVVLAVQAILVALKEKGLVANS